VQGLNGKWLDQRFQDPELARSLRDGSLQCRAPSCDVKLPDLWACLAVNCSFVGCSRSQNKHQLIHSESIQGHQITINFSNLMVWCFECDCEILEGALVDDVRSWVEKLTAPLRAQPSQQEGYEGEEEDDGAATPAERTGMAGGSCGLQNLGNTCYVNASLQGLLHCEPLVKFFHQCSGFLPPKSSSGTPCSARRRLVHSVHDTMRLAYRGNTRAFAPNELVRSVFELNPMFRGYGQQDSQEFLGHILESLHEELRTEVPVEPQPTSPAEGGAAEGGEGAAAPKPQTTSTSVINDIFEGVLLSEVTCLQCKRVSKTDEKFRILPVSIPSKKQQKKLRQEQQDDDNISVSCGSGRRRHGRGWLQMFRRWLGLEKKMNISLADCMGSFCCPEDLRGSDKYKCEHCKTLNDSTKKLSVLQLPEVLCIHVKRFRYDGYFGAQFGSKVSEHVEFPLTDLDVSSFVRRHEKFDQTNTKYDLMAVVNHRGGLGGGHYIAYARNFLDNSWYEFDDAHVSSMAASEVQRTEAYILFYRVKEQPSRAKERAQIMQQVQDREGKERHVYVSGYWWTKWQTLNRPGPIDNQPFFCHHKAPNVPASDEGNLNAIPLSVWTELHGIYGGGPVIEALSVCQLCQEEAAALNARREQEQRQVQQHDRTFVNDGEAWYIIDRQWLHKWLQFVNEEGPVPGPITNSALLNPDGTPRPGLEKGRHYRGVNATVWAVFYKIYGGGPPISRDKLDIYANVMELPPTVTI